MISSGIPSTFTVSVLDVIYWLYCIGVWFGYKLGINWCKLVNYDSYVLIEYDILI